MLRCKFQVIQVLKTKGTRTLRLEACNTKDGDNKDWSRWTPAGEFEIIVTNESAFEKIDAMNPGDLYFIDLTPVPGE